MQNSLYFKLIFVLLLLEIISPKFDLNSKFTPRHLTTFEASTIRLASDAEYSEIKDEDLLNDRFVKGYFKAVNASDSTIAEIIKEYQFKDIFTSFELLGTLDTLRPVSELEESMHSLAQGMKEMMDSQYITLTGILPPSDDFLQWLKEMSMREKEEWESICEEIREQNLPKLMEEYKSLSEHFLKYAEVRDPEVANKIGASLGSIVYIYSSTPNNYQVIFIAILVSFLFIL
jgi:hypothetical protein